MIELLEKEGYTNLRTLQTDKSGEHLIIGTMRSIFTSEIVVGLNEIGSSHRYYYHTMKEATRAIGQWDGKGHPSGNWIKRKGIGEDLPNPNYVNFCR